MVNGGWKALCCWISRPAVTRIVPAHHALLSLCQRCITHTRMSGIVSSEEGLHLNAYQSTWKGQRPAWLQILRKIE